MYTDGFSQLPLDQDLVKPGRECGGNIRKNSGRNCQFGVVNSRVFNLFYFFLFFFSFFFLNTMLHMLNS